MRVLHGTFANPSGGEPLAGHLLPRRLDASAAADYTADVEIGDNG